VINRFFVGFFTFFDASLYGYKAALYETGQFQLRRDGYVGRSQLRPDVLGYVGQGPAIILSEFHNRNINHALNKAVKSAGFGVFV
jgi:hypothetical protein